MPRFYFDVASNGDTEPDEDGTELPTADAAIVTAAEMAERLDLAIHVRDEGGRARSDREAFGRDALLSSAISATSGDLRLGQHGLLRKQQVGPLAGMVLLVCRELLSSRCGKTKRAAQYLVNGWNIQVQDHLAQVLFRIRMVEAQLQMSVVPLRPDDVVGFVVRAGEAAIPHLDAH